MTVDEYLEIERQRGNIISGGGYVSGSEHGMRFEYVVNCRPQSASRPTRSEQLALDSEMDGTYEGERRAEEKRLEDERWARFTDANPRGAGNTMNRG